MEDAQGRGNGDCRTRRGNTENGIDRERKEVKETPPKNDKEKKLIK